MIENPLNQEPEFSEALTDALLADPVLGVKLANIASDLHLLRKESYVERSARNHFYEDKTTCYKLGTVEWMAPNKAVLSDPKTPAGVLLIALKNVLGPSAYAWNPDTIWLELEKHEGLIIGDENRNKIMAALTLIEIPSFYWEVGCFTNTVMAFNDVPPNVDRIAEPTAHEIAWAIYEAELIRHENQLYDPEFDYEPALFVAEILHRDGFVLAPDLLKFAQEALDARNGDAALVSKEEVADAWQKLDKKSLTSHVYEDTPLGVQLARLAGIRIYVDEKASDYEKAIKTLRS